jgi:hypothetical protein
MEPIKQNLVMCYYCKVMMTEVSLKQHKCPAWKDSNPNKPTPLDIQVAGDHYKSLTIQPVEYIRQNNIGYFEGNVIKYVTRWKDKGGIKDLEKAKHYLEMLIHYEQSSNSDSVKPYTKQEVPPAP